MIKLKFNAKMTYIFLILAVSVYLVMMLVTIPQLRHEMNGIEVFDLRALGYSLEEGRAIIETITPSGRQFYTHVQLPLDFIYPFSITMFCISFLKQASNRYKILKAIWWLPIFIMLFDYTENIFIYLMLNGHASDFMIGFSSAMTVLKSMSSTVIYSIILIILMLKIADRIAKSVRKGSE
ncbi:hypothetical protein [Fusibacter ferrireducens]|uniref:Uncharacterized protein n=1 Tax=Fusibacter ferrireducens TaxID=2785058 RepID=A0ABR9ZMU6_9FIRM|nr:hypothetical protein [Fusibacter ferrireducens]MBF4691792.1 hypothetical protein [Fusibacter ferrireducens]